MIEIVQVVSPPPVELVAHYAHVELPCAFRAQSVAIIRDAELVRTSRPVVAFVLRRGEYAEGVETSVEPAVYCEYCYRLEIPTDFTHQDEVNHPQWIEPFQAPGVEPDPIEVGYAEKDLRRKAALRLIGHQADELRLTGRATDRVRGVAARAGSLDDLVELWTLAELAGLRVVGLREAFTVRRAELERGAAA
jgi:hypothetical protein